MDCEIRFLDGQGKLRCSLRAGFMSEQAAVRYAQAVMMAGSSGQYASAEICDADHQYPLFVVQRPLTFHGRHAANRNDGSIRL